MDKRPTPTNQLLSQDQPSSKRRRLHNATPDEGALATALLNLCKGRNETKSELTSRLLEPVQKRSIFSTSIFDESDSEDSHASHNLQLVHHVAGVEYSSVSSEKCSPSLRPACESLPIGKPLSAAPRLPNYIFLKDMGQAI